MKKTVASLYDSLSELLKRHKIEDLTVKDICKEAQICRVVFYAHFDDKYELWDYLFDFGKHKQ